MEITEITDKQRLLHIVDRLRQTDLLPSPLVDKLFGELVALSMTEGTSVCEDPQLSMRTRELAAAGECKMEVHWAKRIIEDPDCLADFPYLANYIDLAGHEHDELTKYSPIGARWAFVGTGPLPLSNILFERLNPTASCTYIDNDPSAQLYGYQVAQTLNGPSTRRSFVTAEADAIDYSGYDVVVMAALVGEDEEQKVAILKHITANSRPGTIIAARSVPDVSRTLLYPRLQVVPSGLVLLDETTPPIGVINNLRIMGHRDVAA